MSHPWNPFSCSLSPSPTPPKASVTIRVLVMNRHTENNWFNIILKWHGASRGLSATAKLLVSCIAVLLQLCGFLKSTKYCNSSLTVYVLCTLADPQDQVDASTVCGFYHPPSSSFHTPGRFTVFFLFYHTTLLQSTVCVLQQFCLSHSFMVKRINVY